MLSFRLNTAATILLVTIPIAFGTESAQASEARIAASEMQYYVSPTGDDANSGTRLDKPLRTVARAARLAGPGSVINVAPGTYTDFVVPANSGTAKAPITIRRVGAGEVVWTTADAPKWDDKFALNLRGREYIVVEGITFRDCVAWINMRDAHHNTIRNCVFDGAKIYNCIRVEGSYNKFLKCNFKRSIPYVTNDKGIPKGADYIEIFRESHYNLVEGCEFGEIPHVAVSVAAYKPGTHRPSHNIIRNNRFHSPRWKCIGLHAAPYTLVENNVFTGAAALFVQFESQKVIMRRNVFHNFKNDVPGDPTYRGAIRIASTRDSGADCNTFDSRIYNNLFTGNERTITSYAARFPLYDNIFKNNIFYNNKQTLWLCQPNYMTVSKNYWINNVLVGTAPGQRILGYAREKYTLAEAQDKLAQFYRGNLEVDPQFVDAAGHDYRLKPGSPCIDAGAALTQTTEAGKGTEIAVADAMYFCDGFGLIAGDMVVVGSNKPARIIKVDYDKKLLSVDRNLSWAKDDAVNLPYSGAGPDIGPFEFRSK